MKGDPVKRADQLLRRRDQPGSKPRRQRSLRLEAISFSIRAVSIPTLQQVQLEQSLELGYQRQQLLPAGGTRRERRVVVRELVERIDHLVHELLARVGVAEVRRDVPRARNVRLGSKVDLLTPDKHP
ncbi:hypothetical protein ABFU84_00295 [Xanthomonas translucens pv. undulosa]|uniref:hypothetical protein n=1 Tax=Xanthomonas campestris pv. translucens TaxID=343 RepID=UPI003CF8A634